MCCSFVPWGYRGVARIFPWGGGGGLSDFIREMFTTGRQTWTVSVILK